MTKAQTRQDPEPIDSPAAEDRAHDADDQVPADELKLEGDDDPQPNPYTGDEPVRQEDGL